LVTEERERIHKLGGFVMDNGRVNGILGVARSLGDFYLSPYVSPEPYVMGIQLTDAISFVVFACDGCFDVITDQEAVDIVKSSLVTNRDPNVAATALRDRAFLLGSGDNISVIVIITTQNG